MVNNGDSVCLWKYGEKERELEKTRYEVKVGTEKCVMEMVPGEAFVMATRDEFAMYRLKDLAKIRVL